VCPSKASAVTKISGRPVPKPPEDLVVRAGRKAKAEASS